MMLPKLCSSLVVVLLLSNQVGAEYFWNGTHWEWKVEAVAAAATGRPTVKQQQRSEGDWMFKDVYGQYGSEGSGSGDAEEGDEDYSGQEEQYFGLQGAGSGAAQMYDDDDYVPWDDYEGSSGKSVDYVDPDEYEEDYSEEDRLVASTSAPGKIDVAGSSPPDVEATGTSQLQEEQDDIGLKDSDRNDFTTDWFGNSNDESQGPSDLGEEEEEEVLGWWDDFDSGSSEGDESALWKSDSPETEAGDDDDFLLDGGIWDDVVEKESEAEDVYDDTPVTDDRGVDISEEEEEEEKEKEEEEGEEQKTQTTFMIPTGDAGSKQEEIPKNVRSKNPPPSSGSAPSSSPLRSFWRRPIASCMAILCITQMILLTSHSA